jgi:hypothetical protein
MYVDRLDITIPAEKLVNINAAFATLETEFDFLIALDRTAAKRMAKMGLRNETFSRSVLEAAAQNPSLIPGALNLPALNRDLNAREVLLPLQQRAQRLHDRLFHTNLVLGADMYSGALAVYKTLKTFGAAAGLGMLLEDLGRRFTRKAPTTATTPVQNPTP